MVIRPTRASVRTGLIGACIFLLYYLYSLYGWTFSGRDGAQVALAFISFPSSAVLIKIFDPLLELLGPYGSAARRVGEWVYLGVSGTTQYFLIGMLIGAMSTSKSAQKE